jgi:hypothetical protein
MILPKSAAKLHRILQKNKKTNRLIYFFMKLLNFLNEHRGKAAAVCGTITAILLLLCYCGVVTGVAYNLCATLGMISCAISLLCVLFEANEEWI